MIEAKPALSRFIGPDKLTVGTNFVYMIMPDIVGGELDQRKRGRAITAFYFDYAIYRPLLLPSIGAGGLHFHRRSTRGWHFFGGAAFDNEVYGTRLVQKRDYYGGTSLLGIGRWDFTLQGTVYQSGVTDAEGFDLAPLANAQFRTSVVPLFRIIDGETIPGLPTGGSPAFLNLVFPMKWDVATQGSHDFENFRVGAELWTRFIATGPARDELPHQRRLLVRVLLQPRQGAPHRRASTSGWGGEVCRCSPVNWASAARGR